MMCLFLLADVAAAEVWLGPGLPAAEGWELFRVTGHREVLQHLRDRKKG